MGLPNGVHHLAIATRDIKAQIEFFTQVVGMELVALYWMHGVPNTVHAFLRMGDSSSIAFVQGPAMAAIRTVGGGSAAGLPASRLAPGRLAASAAQLRVPTRLARARREVLPHERRGDRCGAERADASRAEAPESGVGLSVRRLE